MNRSKALSDIPGPANKWGRLFETFKIFNDPIEYLDNNFKKFGPIFKTYTNTLTTPPSKKYPGTVCIYGPKLIRELCLDHNHFHRSALSHRLYPARKVSARNEVLKRIMTGLTYQRGTEHKAHRSLILPAFQKQKVKAYLPEIIEETEKLSREWRVGEMVDLAKEMNKLILRISARSLFGQSDVKRGQKIGLLIDQWVDFIMSISHLFPFDFPGVPYRKWLDLSHEIEKTTRQIIVEKRAAGANDDSLLSMLIKATDEGGKGLTEDDLVGHISLMLWGSRDAAAAALMWTFLFISLHEQVHEAIKNELKGLTNNTPQWEDFQKLTFTEKAIKESLRLMPPFPMVNRVASADRQLGGYAIPKGTEILMSIYHTHRMPELYDEPDAFIPERWDRINPRAFEYLPFGAGPRMCPGSNLAWQELMVVTALLMKKFRFEIVEGARIDRIVKLGLLPKRGLPMKICSNDGNMKSSVKPLKGNINKMVSSLP